MKAGEAEHAFVICEVDGHEDEHTEDWLPPGRSRQHPELVPAVKPRCQRALSSTTDALNTHRQRWGSCFSAYRMAASLPPVQRAPRVPAPSSKGPWVVGNHLIARMLLSEHWQRACTTPPSQQGSLLPGGYGTLEVFAVGRQII